MLWRVPRPSFLSPVFLCILLFSWVPANHTLAQSQRYPRPGAEGGNDWNQSNDVGGPSARPTPLPRRAVPSRTADRERLQELADLRRAELEKRAQAEREKKAAEAKAAGFVQEARPIPTTTSSAQPASSPASAQTAAPGLVMMLQPFHQQAKVGDKLITEASVYSRDTQAIDAIKLHLRYPPQVHPLQVFDFALAGVLKPGQKPIIRQSDGLLVYEAEFARPIEFTGRQALIQVVWEATGSTSQQRFSLGMPATESTAVFFEGENLLLKRKTSGLARIDATLAVSDENTPVLPRFDRVSPAGSSVATPALKTTETLDAGVGLRLVASQAPDEGAFIVDVMLENPSNRAFGEVRLNLQFDPEKMQVLDWDDGGWIRRGVNIYDAHAHHRYPFRSHLANRVDNQKGWIHYHMKTDALQAMPSGSIARVYLRALSEDALESLDLFAPHPSGAFGATDIRANNRSVLDSVGNTRLSVIKQRSE